DFFKDPMLSLYLYSQIGPNAYKKKKERLTYPLKPKNITAVTRKFTEVFQAGSGESFTVPDVSFNRVNVSSGPTLHLDE
ncbi:hypothetical protein AB8738_15050, partial [Salinicoccus roseus]